MANKEFKIQSTSLSINGVRLDVAANGKLVIPGITRAGSSVAIEVEDTADQTTTWQDIPVVIDGYTYAVLNGDVQAQQDWTAATYSVDALDGDNYIDGITVDSGGTGYTGEVVTYSEVMYAAPTGTTTDPFNAGDWTQIPFRVRCGAGDIESEFGSGGGSSDRITSPDTNSEMVINNDGNVQMPENGALWFNYGYIDQDPDVDTDALRVSGGDGVTIKAAEDTTTWRFNSDQTITFPDGSIQTTAYTGQTGSQGLYICGNVDGTVITSVDGFTWSSPFNTGLSSLGNIGIGGNKIIYTRSTAEFNVGEPSEVGLYSTEMWNVTPTLISGTDNNGGDLYWNEIKYFDNAPIKWVAVGRSVGMGVQPVYAISNDGANFNVFYISNLENITGGTNSWLNDLDYNGTGYFLVGAIDGQSDTGFAFYSENLAVGINADTDYVNTFMPFGSVEYLPDSFIWGSSWSGFDYAGNRWQLNIGNLDPREGWDIPWDQSDNWRSTIGYVPSWADSTSGAVNGESYFIASTASGQIMWWPNLPEGPYVSIPKPYVSDVNDIVRGTTTTIVFSNYEPDSDGEKIFITGVTSHTENNPNTSEQDYNGTYYIKNNNGSYELYLDSELTIPFDTTTFWPPDLNTGTLTWSHGQFIDAVGYGNGVFLCANDDEQVFRSGDGGETWVQVEDINGNYMNDISYGVLGTVANVDIGDFVFNDNEMSTLTGYPRISNSVGSEGGVEIDYYDINGDQQHAMWLNGEDGLQIQINSFGNDGREQTNWNFAPDRTIHFPDDSKQTTAFVGAPCLDRRTESMESGENTATITFTASGKTIIVIASGVETSTLGNESIITGITGLELTWFKRSAYTDPGSNVYQRAELWYAVNDSDYDVTGDITITYSHQFDDQAAVVASFYNVNLTNPWEGNQSIVSNNMNNGYISVPVSTNKANTLGLALFAVPNYFNQGYAEGWSPVFGSYNGGGNYWEYVTLSSKVFDGITDETVTNTGTINYGDSPSYGLTVIIDVLVGATAQSYIETDQERNLVLPGSLKFTDGSSISSETNIINVNTSINFNAESAGFINDIDSSGNFDCWFNAVTADVAGNSYAVGTNDDGYCFIYAFDTNGEERWKVGFDDVNGNRPYPYAIKIRDNTLIVSYNWYNNNTSRDEFGYSVIDKDTGSVIDNYPIKATGDKNEWTVRAMDIDANGNPIIVGTVSGDYQLLPNITARTGSNADSVLVVNNSDLGGAIVRPYDAGRWSIDITGNGDYYTPQGVNFFYNVPTVTVTGSGSGKTVSIRYNDQGNGVYWDYVYQEQQGNNYNYGDVIKVLGSNIGGVDGVDDLLLTYYYPWWLEGYYVQVPPAVATTSRFIMSQLVDFTSQPTWNIKFSLNDQAFIYTPNWQHDFGASENDYFQDVKYDSYDGSIYALGYFQDQKNNTALYKFASNGTILWNKRIYDNDNTGSGEPGSVVVDGQGSVYTCHTNDNGFTVVTKLDNSGTVVWQSVQTNDSEWNNFPQMGQDMNGNLIVYGSWYYYIPNIDSYSYVISSMSLSSSDGSLLWARRLYNAQGYDMYDMYDEYTQEGTTVGNRYYYVSYAYDVNDDQYVAVLQAMPSDGSFTGTYGRWVYEADEDCTWDDNTSYAVAEAADITTTDQATYESSQGGGTTVDDVGATTLNTESLSLGGELLNTGAVSFADGSRLESALIKRHNGVEGNTVTLSADMNGKFFNYYNNNGYIQLPDNANVAIPIGFVLTVVIDNNVGNVYVYGENGSVYVNAAGENSNTTNNWYFNSQNKCGTYTIMKVDTNRWMLNGPDINVN